jgi:hypothetical protein
MKTKRIVSILLCLCMAIGLLSVSALAANYDGWEAATADGVTLTADTDTVTIDGVTYTYKGDVSTDGLDLYTAAPAVAACYKAGDGYILFTPAQGEVPADLFLNNAGIDMLEDEDAGLILLPAGTVTMRVSGENVISAYAEYAYGIYSDKYNPTNLTITSDNYGTLEINVNGTESARALGGADGELASLTIGGNVSVTAAAGGNNSVGTTLSGNLTVGTDARFTTRGNMVDLMLYGEPSVIQNFNGVAVFLNEGSPDTEIHVYGACSLPGFFSANQVGSFNFEGDIYNIYLKVTSGSTLTVPVGKILTVNSLPNLINSGAIVNNGTIVLPDAADADAIKALNLTGTGVVEVNGQYYTNGGVVLKAITGGLTLSGESSGNLETTATAGTAAP